jgi:hypothetical protein
MPPACIVAAVAVSGGDQSRLAFFRFEDLRCLFLFIFTTDPLHHALRVGIFVFIVALALFAAAPAIGVSGFWPANCDW